MHCLSPDRLFTQSNGNRSEVLRHSMAFTASRNHVAIVAN